MIVSHIFKNLKFFERSNFILCCGRSLCLLNALHILIVKAGKISEGLGHKDCCKDIVFYALIYFMRLKYFYNVSLTLSLNEFSIGRDIWSPNIGSVFGYSYFLDNIFMVLLFYLNILLIIFNDQNIPM